MDGRFVNNISFGIPVLRAVNRVANLPLDVHLMIAEPERYIEHFAAAGANRITVHAEACTEIPKALALCRKYGVKPGITLKPATPLSAVLPYLPDADLVLVMSVEPGFGGQAFLPDSVERIRILRNEITQKKLPTLIEVDGGINEKTAPAVAAAGADILVSGSYLFGLEHMEDAIRAFHAL